MKRITQHKYTFRSLIKKEIVTEFLPPIRKSNKVIILCPGMPTFPLPKSVLDFWSKQGYWIFYPRYRGTWESRGIFLKQSPHKDIIDLINQLEKGFVSLWDGEHYSVKNPQVYIFASSFGGPAGLLSSFHPLVKKVLIFSPVIDWKNLCTKEYLNKEVIFFQKAFGGSYRTVKNGWKKLAEGKLYNPLSKLLSYDGKKIHIFYTLDDRVVPVSSIIDFIKTTHSQCTIYKKGGHLGLIESIQKKNYNIIQNFLNKK